MRDLDPKPSAFSLEQALEMQGSGWDGDLEAMRTPCPSLGSWLAGEEPDLGDTG